MASIAQINANRANAQRSTGPKTEEGKAKSSRNRLSHGFLSNTRFLFDEDSEEFFALLNDLIGEYQPATPTEQFMVEDMAHNRWVSGRAIRIQHDLLNRNYKNMAGELSISPDVDRQLPLFIRYQTTADRAFHKAHTELVKAQKERKKSEIGFESQKVEVKAKEPAAAPQKPQNPPVVMPNPAPESPAVKEMAREMASRIEEMRAGGR